MTILDEIIAYKRDEVAAAKTARPVSSVIDAASKTPPPRGFFSALERAATDDFALIAEIKKASPSKGLIRKDFSPAEHARAYESGGATCLSVLTDGPSFQGDLTFLDLARRASSLPILRKDFMVDAYQVVEARANGADCILIIMACLSDDAAGSLMESATEWGLDVLVEVHDRDEMARAINLKARLIGINNRNLKTFETTLETTRELSEMAPDGALLVSESGIRSHQDLEELSGFGVRAFLVGETLMRQADVAAATRALLGKI
ncbi:MAG: indole-3-glycerol phosphate synthase TrpC [Pseudomonadota bacterium]